MLFPVERVSAYLPSVSRSLSALRREKKKRKGRYTHRLVRFPAISYKNTDQSLRLSKAKETITACYRGELGRRGGGGGCVCACVCISERVYVCVCMYFQAR